ncbi:uncharacterized protein [Littorina saxatilis]|uniref:Uncharacterized protein n=1 Tax=Littorina saxatilis TaxID=31220 RepID=A0AAN9FYD8_9CAEN
MKLRDFMANSLPRVRGRRKKGQTTSSGTAATLTATAVAVAATAAATSATPSPTEQHDSLSLTSPKPARQESHGNRFHFGESRFGFLERLVGKDSPVKRLFESKDRHGPVLPPSGAASEERIYHEVQEPLRSKTGRAASVPDASSLYGCVEVTSLLREGAVCPCGEYGSTGAVSTCPTHRDCDADSSSLYAGCQGYADSVTSYDSTPGSQRGLRNRSRIRTNPWLPSPRPSPYCVRSLSSPCASSRSPSPSSSSPVPPSSSDNTSPLTSHGVTRESQLHRHHRRHRRHHSEINAADLTRHSAFDPHLTDTEQYFSTLDSGIGETAPSPDFEQDIRSSNGASKKNKTQNPKRKSSEKDSHSQSLGFLRGFSFAPSVSPSPKVKPRSRQKSKSSSSRGVVVNRDSQFWDSDSSRSPPCGLKSYSSTASRPSPRGADTNAQGVKNSDSAGSSSKRPEADTATCDGESKHFGLTSHKFLPKTAALDACSTSVLDESSTSIVDESTTPLSLSCEDIGLITSNIEQLAQNISFEYEEGFDTSFESTSSTAKHDDKCASLRALFNIDSEDRAIFPDRGQQCNLDLDFSSFAQSRHCQPAASSGRDTARDTESATPGTDLSSASEESMPTADVAVQTDFADDDEEEHSGSDWLASTESGSDWLVSNGSGSDWPASGETGEGSGIATDAEEEEERREEECGWGVGGKVWGVPDVMQDSTDTGYSSLSRDGRLATDNNNNNSNHTRNTDDSSDSTHTPENKSSVSHQAPARKTRGSDCEGTSMNSDKPTAKLPPSTHHPVRDTLVYDSFDDAGDSLTQRVSYEFEFDVLNGQYFEKSQLRDRKEFVSKQGPEFCSCSENFSKGKNTQEEVIYDEVYEPTFSLQRQKQDDLVPYPYDVTRFNDVSLPKEKGKGSVSLLSPDAVSVHLVSARQKKLKPKPTPRHTPYSGKPSVTRDDADDEFCSCSVTSDGHVVTNNDVGAPRTAAGLVYHKESHTHTPHMTSAQYTREENKQRRRDLSSQGQRLRDVSNNLKERRSSKEGLRPTRGNVSQAEGYHENTSSSSFYENVLFAQKNEFSSLYENVHFTEEDVASLYENVHLAAESKDGRSKHSNMFPSATKNPRGAVSRAEDTNTLYENVEPAGRRSLREDTTRHESRDNSCRDNIHTASGHALRENTTGLEYRDTLNQDDLPSSGRSLRQVTASLADKVFLLRQEKQVVNKKIREAREEEMVRQQLKLRFQRLLDIHRKQILLQTLQDMKHRLQSQSDRLQASYSTVLNIQKRYA